MAEDTAAVTEQTAQPGDEPAPETTETQDEQQQVKTYTQAEVDEIVNKAKANARSRAYRREQRLKAQFEQGIHQAVVEPGEHGEESEPRRKDDETYEDFVARRAEWRAERAVERKLAESEARRQESRQHEEARELNARWEKAKEAGRKAHPDFDDVTGRDDLMITVAMAHAIKDSDIGHEIAYYLATNQDEAEEIAAMSQAGQIRAIGRLEAQLTKPKDKPPRRPSEPIQPVETRGKDNSLELTRNLSNDEWNRIWDLRRERKARAERGG